MIPLSLPEEDRRLVLRSFWVLISALCAVLASVLAWTIGVPILVFGLVAFIGVGSLALTRELLVRRLYHAWNNRIVRPLSNMAISVILRVCLLLIFTATGRTGSRLQRQPNLETLWLPRDGGANHTSLLPFTSAPGIAAAPKGWIRNYFRWAVQTQNVWAIFLIPFFCMLRMVSTEEPATSGGNIYTLF
jgi:hypothetical protein